MKSKFKKLLVLLITASLFSCGNKTPIVPIFDSDHLMINFTEREYSIKSGEKIAIKENYKDVTFEIIQNKLPGINIDSKTGVITFDNTIPNYTQILVVATSGEYISNPVVVTLYYDYEETDISFLNQSNYITDGEFITAKAVKSYAIKYSLKTPVDGVSIEEATGKVSYTPMAVNNSKFTVVANAHDISSVEKDFYVLTQGFVAVEQKRQVIEKGGDIPAKYLLDFSDSEEAENDGVLGLVNSSNENIPIEYYSYNKENNEFIINGNITDVLNDGEQELKIVTSRNAVKIQLDIATKFIYDAEDLASINESEKSLSGFYLLMNDIDLTSYLSEGGKGHNDGKGWNPIGSYQDVIDTNEATRYSFKGTFDGNGFVISGLSAKRKDVKSFNFGLFGYVTSSGIIRNLGVEGISESDEVDVNVSSYSGGFVGSNSGLIENCYCNVNIEVLSGENAYRYVGGFAGSNFGIIRNCYVIGKVSCDKEFGKIVGSNEGDVENCYSFEDDDCQTLIGIGFKPVNSILFDTLDDMEDFDFSSVFSSEHWSFKEELPSLHSSLVEYNVRKIEVVVPEEKVFVGDRLYLESQIYPMNLHEDYIDLVEYEIEGEGFALRNNYISTLNAIDQKVIIKATLEIDGKTFTSIKEVEVCKKVETLEIETSLTSLDAGKSYALNATFSPSDAKDKITYKLSYNYLGVKIIDNVLSIDEECSLDKISFYAESESGKKSKTITLSINRQLSIESNPTVIYQDSNEDLKFTLDGSLDLDGLKVSIFGKEVEYSKEGNVITISRELIEDSKDMKVRVLFELKDGTTYASDAYCFSHKQYNKDNIEGEVITISTVEDFFKYFNIDPNSDYDETKEANYSKTFILTNDIDFQGKVIYSIGHGDQPFSGKFYGNGYTISNFVINQNEKAHLGKVVEGATEEEIKIANKAKESSFYGVGFFGVLSGEVYDLNLKAIKVTAKNFAGGLVGMLTTGKVENCKGFSLYVRASEYQYSAEDVKVGSMIGKNYTGTIICVYGNNLISNTVG